MKVLALIGGSGSGKSTVLDGIRDHFGDRISILSLDDYYKPTDQLPVDRNGQTNFDLPEVIDHHSLIRDIDQLRSGEPVVLKTYTYNRDVMKSVEIAIIPNEWLVVEGLFVLADPQMAHRVQLIGYIDASPEVRLERRIHRDGIERGYSEEEVRYQWKHHVRPADVAYIEPWRDRADVVIDNEHDWKKGLNELIHKMENHSQL